MMNVHWRKIFLLNMWKRTWKIAHQARKELEIQRLSLLWWIQLLGAAAESGPAAMVSRWMSAKSKTALVAQHRLQPFLPPPSRK